jgi:hypothetical protein
MEDKIQYVKFHTQGEYREVTYLQGETYAVVNDPPGFVDRWVKRGCEVVSCPESYLADPRFPELAISESRPVEPAESVEEKEEKPKVVKKRRGRRKKVDKVEDTVENDVEPTLD